MTHPTTRQRCDEGCCRGRRTARRARAAAGFTLIEVMISLAIALLLIVGVNQIFKITSDTTGAGQTMSAIARDDRAAHHVIANDLHAIKASDVDAYPFLLFQSRQQYAFRNAQDRAQAMDPNDASLDPAFANVPGSSAGTPKIPVTFVNYRSHRVDRIAFFARNLFFRQTSAPSGPFTTSTSSPDAYMWYGHAQLPNTKMVHQIADPTYKPSPAPAFYGPGDTSTENDTNLLASDWILARKQIVMVSNPPDNGYYIFPNPGAGKNTSYQPFAVGTKSPTAAGGSTLEQSYFDMVDVDMATYIQSLPVYNGAAPANWYAPLIDFRYQVNPFPQRPITSAAAATASPIFLRACTQFIVEYAGNYLTQDNDPNSPTYGKILKGEPDPSGKLDFIVEQTTTATGGKTLTRRIRWYGFPRDVHGDGIVDLTDVLPLRYVYSSAGASTVPDNEFFSTTGTNAGNSLASAAPPNAATAPYVIGSPRVPTSPVGGKNYAAGLLSSSYPSGTTNDPVYVCAWTPQTTIAPPKMLRITVALDDPAGRLGDAQTYEYVVNLQQ